MSNDAAIKKFRATVEAKRTELGAKPKISYVTNGSLELNGERINLNTLTTQAKCVELVTILVARNQFMGEANKLLGTDINPNVGEYTIDQWISDIKQRVDVIAWEANKKKLQRLETQLKDLMSEDAKTAETLDAIAAELEG